MRWRTSTVVAVGVLVSLAAWGGGADLVITDVSGPLSADLGEVVTIDYTVRNRGNADIVGDFSVGIYVLDTDRDVVLGTDTAEVTKDVTGGLTARTDAVDSVSLTIPPGLTPGTHYVAAYADWAEAIGESDEGNNQRRYAIEIAVPDLVVTAVTGPVVAEPGDTITVSSTVENIGGGAAAAFTVGVYLSDDDVIDPAADTEIGTWQVTGVLAAGASASNDTQVTIDAATAAGAYFVGAYVDSTDAVAEDDETNNALADTGGISIVDTPDFVVESVTGPTSASAGDTITVTNVVKNVGATDATDFSMGIYLLEADRAVVLGTDTELTSWQVTGGLGLLLTASDNTQVTLPDPLPAGGGEYFIVAYADMGEAVTEDDETNNQASHRISLDIPDFLVVSVTAPAAAEPGGTITVDSTVINEGLATVTGFTVGVYLSDDDVIDPAADTELATWQVPSGLDSGATASDSTPVTIDAATAVGPYFVGVYVDINDDVVEASETNNGLADANGIEIVDTPDLTVTMTGPADTWPGGTVTFTNTVTNEGATDTTDFTVGIYILESDRAVDLVNDTLLASWVVTGGLALQETSSSSTQVTVPATLPLPLPGTYFVVVYADTGNDVGESDETNNEFSLQITIAAEAPYTPTTPLGGGCSPAKCASALAWLAPLALLVACLLRSRRARVGLVLALLLVASGCSGAALSASGDTDAFVAPEPAHVSPELDRLAPRLPATIPGEVRASGIGVRTGVFMPGPASDDDYLSSFTLGVFRPGRLPGMFGFEAVPFELGLDYARISSADVDADVYTLRFDCLFGKWMAIRLKPEFYYLGGYEFIAVDPGKENEWEWTPALNFGAGLTWDAQGLDARLTYSFLLGSGNIFGILSLTGGYRF